MARLIFIGLVVATITLLWRGRDTAHGRAFKRLLLLGFAGVVTFTILFPEVTSIAANWVGIGRGTDLVFYLTSFGVMLLAALTYLRFKRLEDRMAALTTELALRDWDDHLAAEGLVTVRERTPRL